MVVTPAQSYVDHVYIIASCIYFIAGVTLAFAPTKQEHIRVHPFPQVYR